MMQPPPNPASHELVTEIATSARVHDGVRLGPGAFVEDFAILGRPTGAPADSPIETEIGPGAVIRSHTVIYAGNVIGARFATGHGVLVRESNIIGDDVSIGSHTVIEHHVLLGDGVRIHSGAFIPEFTIIEAGAWIGPRVIFTNVPHPLCPKAKECAKGPRIGRGAKIGAGAIVLPGVVVGENALVGAGSLVLEDVPARAVVAGHPARVLKDVDALTCPYDLIERPYEPAP